MGIAYDHEKYNDCSAFDEQISRVFASGDGGVHVLIVAGYPGERIFALGRQRERDFIRNDNSVDATRHGPGSEVDVAEVVSTLVSLMDGEWIELAIDSDSDTPEASSLAYVRLVMGH